ncbi:unnamed protein product [Ilex paraguariensis]|uniref:Uncharacterized protein n=1 Tax=Ilex paraguariensis TaxID=185542 RepID=A0ABC8TXN9_9AQUA
MGCSLVSRQQRRNASHCTQTLGKGPANQEARKKTRGNNTSSFCGRMAQFQNHELEYIVDDYYDTTDFDDNPFEEDELPRSGGVDDSLDSDFEDDLELSKPKTDTSAQEARNGKDIQGIPWERLNFTRDKYRESRLKQYKNYENLSCSREELEKECKQVEKGHNFYDFQFNTRLVKSTIVHFQVLCLY